METWSIKPVRPQTGRIELCGLDFIAGYGYFDGVRYFDERLDVDRLREALTQTVTRYPLLSGTLRQDDGRVFIDYDGPGATFAVEEVDRPCPPFGPGIAQVNRRDLFLPKPTTPAEAYGQWQRPFGKPLLLIKITRFSDGRYALGGTTCHVVGDATTSGQWFDDCYRHYSGAATGPEPVFARETVTSLGDLDADAPSGRSGMTTGEQPPFEVLRELFFEARYACVSVSARERAALDTVIDDMRDTGISVNDLLHALLFKTFAHSLPESQTEVVIDLTYDLRRIKTFNMPANYCGNTILHRWLKLPRVHVLKAHCTELAALIKSYGKSDPESARQDIGFLEREYRSRRVSDNGVLTRVLAPLGRGSMIVNNLTASPVTKSNFGGLALWTDMAINDPLPIRMAMMYPDLKGGLAIMLVLSPDQVTLFPPAWSRCLEELTSGRLPSSH